MSPGKADPATPGRADTPPSRAGRRRLFRLAAVALAVALTLAALELGLRVVHALTAVDLFHVDRDRTNTDPTARLKLIDLIRLSRDRRRVYETAPGVRGVFKGAPVALNAEGLRGPVLPTERPPRPDRKADRIVLLGDSHAFGWAIPYEDAFPSLVAKRRRARSGRELEVLNLGVPGYNTDQEVAAWQAVGRHYEPDAVVLLACRNDAGLANFIHAPRSPLDPTRSFLGDALSVHWRALLHGRRYRNRFVPRGLGRTAKLLSWRAYMSVSDEDRSRLPAHLRDRVGPEAVRRAMDELAASCRERDIPVLFLFYPEPGEAALREPMTRRARELGWIVVDLQPAVDEALRAAGGDWLSLVISERDRHATAAGHRLIARELERALAPVLANSQTRGNAPEPSRVKERAPPDRPPPAGPSPATSETPRGE